MEWGINLMEKKFKTLNSKILIPSISIIILITLISMSSFKIYFQDEFDKYVESQNISHIEDVVSGLKMQYNNETWNLQGIESISMEALDKGILTYIYDKNNNEIWNIEAHNKGLCSDMIKNINYNMSGKYENDNSFDEYVKEIKREDEIVGYIKIRIYGPVFYLDDELAFMNVVDKIIIFMGVSLLISYILISLWLSKAITNPLKKVMIKAKYISNSDYDKDIQIETDIIEISNLSKSINNLGENIKKQENIRKRLSSDISHELRTPLTNIEAHLEAMIDGIWEPTVERLESVKEESRRLSKLVLDINSVTKYDDYTIKLNLEDVNLKELITNIKFNFLPKLKENNIELIISGIDITILVDRDKITQIIINLLTNAIRYTQSGGKIVIDLWIDNGCACFSVKDEGIGISEIDLPYIFERFYRADKSRTRLTGGTGIGLTIVKAIIKAHNGKISVLSKEKVGTTFIVKIPINSRDTL